MVDRWNEDRERDGRNRERSYGRDRAYRPEPYEGREDRSFQPSPDDRPRVFGERETGYSYTGPEYGAGGYTGYGARGVGDRGYGGRNYSTGGGRGYGADVYQERGATPSGAPGPSDDEHRYDRSFRADRDNHSRFGFGQDTDGPAYARGAPRQEYERDDGRRGGGFMERASRFFGGDRDEESHRGRGPTGYRRSDDRISEDVHDRLTEDRHIDASSISIAVKDGEVTLSGTVTDRHAKHHAEHIVEDLSGVSHVQNNLRVADRDRNRGAVTNTSAPLGENARLSEQAAGKA